MTKLLEFSPLKSIAIPNIGRMEPKGLALVIGPNSSGKTQLLKDIQSRVLGQSRKLVVCDDIEINRAQSLDALLNVLFEENHIGRRVDANNNVFIEPRTPHFGGSGSSWSFTESQIKSFFAHPVSSGSKAEGTSDKFLEHFGRSFIASLFLDRRLNVINAVGSFDYEASFPTNELQALYIDSDAQKLLSEEAKLTFGKAIWIDNTRSGMLCLRVGNGSTLPSAEDRLQPAKMREYRLIEDEGDGFKSYIGICLTLLVGKRPIVLIDEPEMCLHPPQAYALGRFIGRHGVSTDRITFVATHSSHILRGIVETSKRLEIIRLSRLGLKFTGRLISHQVLKTSIEKPSTKAENILDGLFAEAVTVVESEGDRLVYGTTWDRISDEFSHDVHFVSVGGLGGIADPCALYRQLKIPVCVAADLDVIRELGTFESILKAVAPNEAVLELMAACRKIIEAVKALGPIFSEDQTRTTLSDLLAEKLHWQDVEQLNRVRSMLTNLCGGLSQTARLKQGIDSLKAYPIFYELVAFLNQCRSHGVFLVPVGELEDWVPGLVTGGPGKKKKAEWANYAANRLREVSPESGDVWEFVRQIANFQRDQGARLAGYPS